MNETPRTFFIGWESKPLPRATVVAAWISTFVALALAGVTAAWQQTIGGAVWDFSIREHRGLFLAEPTPLLIETGETGDQKMHFLVREQKFGLSADQAKGFHLKEVSLRGSLLENGEHSMIEVSPDSIQILGQPAATAALSLTEVPGTCVVRGEIVDSKCYLGAMNPGLSKPHRACAIHCLRGGVPPMLLARAENGDASLLLLTGKDGEAINAEILDFVAEPVEVSGRLLYAGPLPILQIDPATIKRL